MTSARATADRHHCGNADSRPRHRITTKHGGGVEGNAAKGVSATRRTFMNADLFETDFSKATVITMVPAAQHQFNTAPKLLEMKPGTAPRIEHFDMGEWRPEETATVTEGCTTWCTALLWICPLWLQAVATRGGELALTQEFQMLSGTLTLNATARRSRMPKCLVIRSRSVRAVRFTPARLTGSVIEGTAKTNGSSVPWSATRAEK